MRFVFDENHPEALALMLAPLIEAQAERYEVAHVRRLGLSGKSDADLLRALREYRSKNVLMTTDRAMRRRPSEQAAVAETGAVIVVGVGNWNQAALWERARMMLWWWQTIADSAATAHPGTYLELPWRRTTKPLRRWQPSRKRL